MAKRKRRRPRDKVATVDYIDAEGNVLSLRESLSAATVAKIVSISGKAAASADDVWQRRSELLFERLVVSWQVAGLPLQLEEMGDPEIEDGPAHPHDDRPRFGRTWMNKQRIVG